MGKDERWKARRRRQAANRRQALAIRPLSLLVGGRGVSALMVIVIDLGAKDIIKHGGLTLTRGQHRTGPGDATQ